MGMDFRVWDKGVNKWVDQLYLDQWGNAMDSVGPFSGWGRTEMMPNTRFVKHMNTHYLDKNDKYVFEGDICRITLPNDALLCVVTYVPNCCSYLLAHYNGVSIDLYEFYENAKSLIEVVGNVFDNPDMVDELRLRENELAENYSKAEVGLDATA